MHIPINVVPKTAIGTISPRPKSLSVNLLGLITANTINKEKRALRELSIIKNIDSFCMPVTILHTGIVIKRIQFIRFVNNLCQLE